MSREGMPPIAEGPVGPRKDKSKSERAAEMFRNALILFVDDEHATESKCVESINNIQKAVTDWNGGHTGGKPVELMLVINSSKVCSEDQRAEFENGYGIDLSKAVVNPNFKGEYVTTVMQALEHRIDA